MSCLTYFSAPPQTSEFPQGFPNPFSNIPHPLAGRAAHLLQTRLQEERRRGHYFDAIGGGRMFGVLVVRDGSGRIGFLSGFSGCIDGQAQQPGFVPPIYDQREVDSLISIDQLEIDRIQRQLESTERSAEMGELQRRRDELLQQRDREVQSLRNQHRQQKAARGEVRRMIARLVESDSEGAQKVTTRLSFESQRARQALHALRQTWRDKLGLIEQRIGAVEAEVARLTRKLRRAERRRERKRYSAYRLGNWRGETTSVAELFSGMLPVPGTGECAATRLLHYAQRHALTPLALAEFWWGPAPADEVRHHGRFYPACRGRCGRLLPFMMKGLPLMPRLISNRGFSDDGGLEIVYEDEAIVVINKPGGLLSVPGKEIHDSVLCRLRRRYPDATGAMLVHRLDMATSGLLLAAKGRAAHRVLHQQFEQRRVEKRYVALLSKRLSDASNRGTVELPLRVDIFDRPRQRVCTVHGKSAVTHWEVIARECDRTRLYFYPVTGRTHQLRLHAAHKGGMDAPIVGDELYGEPDSRLMLHAERLVIDHPVSGVPLQFCSPPPF